VVVAPVRRLRALVVLLCAASVVAACSGGGTPEARLSKDNDPASPPSITAATGQALHAAVTTPYEKLHADGSDTLASYLGRPVVVNFFASWCNPCVTEMPDFQKVHEQLGDKVVFVGISADDRRKDAEDIVAKTKVSYDLGFDPDQRVLRAFGGLGLPTTVLIRADGTVAETRSGAISSGDLRAKIQKHFGVS
jgi:thiol-disulfide isomerase/thioredoxin